MQPRADERLALLRGLVEIPSVSGAEGEAASFLVRWMAAHGFRAQVDEVGNAVGVLEPPGDDEGVREIVLLGHIDTVGGAPLVHLTDGRLYGRGAVDAKGPLAAFTAAAALAGPVPGWRVVVVGAVEEETASSRGARHIAAAHRPDLAVIGEPSGWQRATLGYKGRLLAEVVVRQALSHRSGGVASACEVAVGCWNSVTAGVLGAERRAREGVGPGDRNPARVLVRGRRAARAGASVARLPAAS